MTVSLKTAVWISAAAALAVAVRAAAAEVRLPEKDKFKIVVLAGQSNMAGRGKIDPADNKPHPRVVMMNAQGEWVPCVDPVHFDSSRAGVGPGKTFGEALAESDPSITVGLVPTAVGATSIMRWRPGETAKWKRPRPVWHPYDDCIARAKKALERGTLAAILWHQGESDCSERGAPRHREQFPEFVARLRKDLGAEGVPLIVGGLRRAQAQTPAGRMIAATEKETCERTHGPGKYVPAKDDYGLEPDRIHFDRAAQQDFGRRYFEAYQEVVRGAAEAKVKKQREHSDVR